MKQHQNAKKNLAKPGNKSMRNVAHLEVTTRGKLDFWSFLVAPLEAWRLAAAFPSHTFWVFCVFLVSQLQRFSFMYECFFLFCIICVCAAFDPPCSSSRAVTTCVFVKRQRGRFVLISQRAELFTPASPPDSSEQLVTANGERFTAYSTREFGETWRWISAKPRQSFYIFIYIYIHSSGFYLKDMTGQPEAIAGSKERKIYEILVSRFSFCFCVCSNKANMKLQNYKNIKRSQT